MTPDRPAFGYDPLGSASDPESCDVRIRLASPVMGEEEAEVVRQVLESGVLTNGPWTRRFEQAMAARHHTEHAVALANGTVALAAMLLAADIGPGDEIIVPSLTFIATATAVLHAGATPVFADVEPVTLTLDPDDVARRITPRTRGVIPVHYGGQMAEMDRLADLAASEGLEVFEDAAQAHGAHLHGRPAGSWGRAGMFSFTPIKVITTGEGAVVTTDDGELAQRMRLLRNHGMSKQYHHETLGWNWRLTELQAAIGVCQLDRLDQILAVKRSNAETFAKRLAGVEGVSTPTVAAGRDHPYTLYTLTLPADRRDAVATALDAVGIETRIYFPPAHHQPIFAAAADPELPVTEEMADRILSIPFHSRITDGDLTEMADIIERVVTGS